MYMDYCRETTTTQWERDEDDDTVKKDDDITKAAGFEITSIFREKEVVYLVQVFLHGKYGI